MSPHKNKKDAGCIVLNLHVFSSWSGFLFTYIAYIMLIDDTKSAVLCDSRNSFYNEPPTRSGCSSASHR